MTSNERSSEVTDRIDPHLVQISPRLHYDYGRLRRHPSRIRSPLNIISLAESWIEIDAITCLLPFIISMLRPDLRG